MYWDILGGRGTLEGHWDVLGGSGTALGCTGMYWDGAKGYWEALR